MDPCVFPSPCSSPFQECFNSSQTAPLYNSYYHKCIKIACTLIFLFKTFRLKAFHSQKLLQYHIHPVNLSPVFSNKRKISFSIHFSFKLGFVDKIGLTIREVSKHGNPLIPEPFLYTFKKINEKNPDACCQSTSNFFDQRYKKWMNYKVNLYFSSSFIIKYRKNNFYLKLMYVVVFNCAKSHSLC